MLFTLCEHYSFYNEPKDDPLISLNNQNTIICFVCFEEKYDNENTMKLNKQSYFIKSCQCDGDLHHFCLKKWFEMKKSCPICRKPMIQKSIFVFGIFNNIYIYYLYLFCARNYSKIVRCIFVFTIFYFIFKYTILLDKILYKSQCNK